ncbi:acylphosphatase [Radiobacillus deserti]|uniref:Acylphosphatase n=1 Tax=Radiobacillus deserti TaxID=2594883 RepID=A0A516KG58_9BACI|nr:acylphosphatase [Radiobacillus deserti]QDP40388.1 acylphosphatase [Radiobacillus deserti]
MISQHIVVHGKVQGVGFRATAQLKAKSYGLNGWVKNTNDGNVEMVVEGPEEDVEAFKSVIMEGLNPFAKVSKLEVIDQLEVSRFDDFQIKY